VPTGKSRPCGVFSDSIQHRLDIRRKDLDALSKLIPIVDKKLSEPKVRVQTKNANSSPEASWFKFSMMMMHPGVPATDFDRDKELRRVQIRLRNSVNRILVAGDKLRVRDQLMIPRVAYDVEYGGEKYKFVKDYDGSIKIYEIK
jgi:hypothetical protein